MKNLFLFSVFFLVYSSSIYGQFSLKGETQTYYYSDNKSVVYQIDTGLQNFEEYNFENTSDWEYFNTSILGTAQQKISFEWKRKNGFEDGNIFFDNYKYDIDRLKYFNTEKFPYSELSYLIGTRLEQKVHLVHAQNIKNRFKFALEAHGMSASGIYDDSQRTRNFGITFYGIYSSKNNRYHLETDFVYSSIKANEIGGVVQDVLLDSTQRINKLFYDSYLSDATTQQSDFAINLKNSYGFGFMKLDSINDTLSVRTFFPVFKLKHSIGTNIVKNSFSDYSPDSLFYDNLNFFQNIDSTVYTLRYHNIPHRVAFEYLGTKNGDSVSYRNLKAEVALQHNNLEIRQNGFERTYNNLMLSFQLSSNDKAKSNIAYRLNSSFFLTGYNKLDFLFNADASYDFNKNGKISASLIFENISPSWIENFYQSSGLNWINDFKKKQIVELNASYVLPKHHLKIALQADFLKNYIYFNESSTPVQTDAKIVYWNFSIQKDTKWKFLHWNNFIGYQFTNHQSILPLPALFLKTSLYADIRLFKKNMFLNVGFDLRFNTAFQARAWNPVISQFYVQDQRNMMYTPIVDVFLATKVKSFRLYAKLNYANEGLFQKNNYKALNFPSNGRTFSIGFKWRFFE